MHTIKTAAIVACINLFFSFNCHATKAVNDDFVLNGTSSSDASYFGSSSASAIETNSNSIGLVSGTSGRQMHALFDTQTLANAGDMLKVSVTFVTPATIGTTQEDLRIGVFDHLDRNTSDKLAQDTSYSSSSPNSDYIGLPGYYLELDVESADPATDLEFRRSNPSDSGRLLATNSGFTSLGSGPNIGYSFTPDTEYSATITFIRTSTGGLNITADFLDESFSVTDASPASYDFGMLALGASSTAFGSTSSVDTADNGIDITKVVVHLIPFTDPPADTGARVVDDNFADDGTLNTDAAYYTSSNTNAIEFNPNSVGIVSGGSGRAIHALFEKQSLEQAGDLIRAGITFTTPATVASVGEDFRLGLFDPLDRNNEAQLAQNLTYSSGSPNPLFDGLPGFYLDLDVEMTNPRSDLEIRRSNPSTSGRLLTTTSGFTLMGSGPDLGYIFEPNTEYTVFFTIERNVSDQLEINGNFLGRSFTVIDENPLSFDFGMLALSSSGGAFGSSNSPGDDDNGIDLTHVTIEFVRQNPVEDDFATNGSDGASARYFGSTGSSAIEFNSDSVGLVSGTSARQIHSLFETQTLAKAGDSLEASITFTTPATVASTNEDLRFALFDHLGRDTPDRLAQNTSFNSSNPNADYSDLPGFYLELDVEASDSATDLELRRSDPTTSGRSITTNTGFTQFTDGNGEDIGYALAADTQYTVHLNVTRTEESALSITAEFLDNQLTVIDTAPESFDFGMLAIYASSSAMGTSTTAGEADNGIDINQVTVTFNSFFDPEEIEIIPPEPPSGDHPDVEIIPDLSEDDDDDFPDIGAGGQGGGSGPGSGADASVRTLPAILSLLLSEDSPPLTAAEMVARHFGLDPNSPPWENFDLTTWALDSPNVDPEDGFSARTTEADLAVGNLFPGAEEFFFTGSDGAMVFKSIVGGARTSNNTSYPRTELREMLRAGDTSVDTQGVNANNWALDHQPENPNIAARGGSLKATLSIDQVTTTGNNSQLGRVIIGQIHASVDEPIRLYYRKLPHNTRGVIYAAHELNMDGGPDVYFEIIGNRANSAPDPENGIALGELFSYEINNVGSEIEVIIRRGDKDGEIIETLTFDMNTVVPGGSNYDVVDEWMYFKAGAYTQNNSGWVNDFDQVRFYRLENTH